MQNLFAPLVIVGVALYAGCTMGSQSESTTIDECDRQLVIYESCLRKTGMPSDQIASRTAAARGSMTRAAGTDEASLETLKAKCVQATKQMERSCL